MARKRGKLSNEEMEFIRVKIGGMSIEQIAAALNRTVEPVKRYCLERKLTYEGMAEDEYDDTLLRQRLEGTPYWKEVKEQFTKEELDYFAITWINIIKQFKDDTLYSEEMQLKQWVTLDIMCNRVLRDRKRAIEQLDRLQNELEKKYKERNSLEEGTEEHRELARELGALEMEVAHIRNSLGAFVSEHTKLLDKVSEIQRSLKMARLDRIKKIDDAKSNWAGLVKALEDESIRERVGEDAAILNMAMLAAKDRLSKPHVYEDGTIDQPLLNSETVDLYEEQQESEGEMVNG